MELLLSGIADGLSEDVQANIKKATPLLMLFAGLFKSENSTKIDAGTIILDLLTELGLVFTQNEKGSLGNILLSVAPEAYKIDDLKEKGRRSQLYSASIIASLGLLELGQNPNLDLESVYKNTNNQEAAQNTIMAWKAEKKKSAENKFKRH